jgi:HEAT repeat protein
VIQLKGTRLDAALYWKAYAQNRLGQRADALTTLAELSKNHPASRYARSAAVLEAEVRRDVGQPVRPQDSTDDEIRLMALQSLQHRDPEQAIPMLEKVLEGTSGPKVKARALFILAQSDNARAREVLRRYATGSSTPELQLQAVQYLGVHGGQQSRAVLGEVYAASQDLDVKRRILRAFMVAGDRDRLLNAARGEQQEELRTEAVAQLGVMGAHAELWDLYQKEASPAVKRRIIRSMHVGGSVDRLIELAKAEQNPELRREAVRTLGLMPSAKTADALVQIYGADRTPDTRKAAIQALFIQNNASALVALARKEQDQALRKELVEKLALMDSKAATDYMLELLGK